MKFKVIGASLLALFANASFAVNPVPGFYLGLGGGLTYGTKQTLANSASNPVQVQINDRLINPPTYDRTAPYSSVISGLNNASISYGFLGDFLYQIGYRLSDNIRFEGQFLYNTNLFDRLSAQGPFRVASPNITTTTPTWSATFPNSVSRKGLLMACPAFSYNGSSNAAGSYSPPVSCSFNGRTNYYGGLVNLFYDFVNFSGESSFAPYLGVGVGFAQTQTILKLQAGQQDVDWTNASTNSVQQGTVLVRYETTKTSVTSQGIVGFNYFLDDFTAFFMDYRYVGASTSDALFTGSYGVHTLNAGFNFAIDKMMSDLSDMLS